MRHSTNPWVVLVLVCLAQFMVVLDATVVNVALPSIQQDLGLSEANLQWVVNAYTLVFGGFLLLGGRAGDLLGRKRLFLCGVVVFTTASLLDGLAWSSGALIASRALQGLGGAFISPAALAIITTTFAEGAERSKALAVWAAIASGGAAVGLVLGGALTQAFSWPWIFFINVPVGIITFVLSLRADPESRDERAERNFDVAGAVTVTSGLMLLVYAIVNTQQKGWTSVWTLGTAAVAFALLVAFVVIELRATAPLVRLDIFRTRTLTDRERGDAARRVRTLRDVLLQLALHPASARIRPARSGPRVPSVHGRNHDLGRAELEVRGAGRRPHPDDHRTASSRSPACSCSRASRWTARISPTSSRRSCSPRWEWVRCSSR